MTHPMAGRVAKLGMHLCIQKGSSSSSFRLAPGTGTQTADLAVQRPAPDF